ncbi:MAG: hypothetical protein OJF49_001859 [Ktedonobacterales bacterium]|jgi:tetratricopeptide (TPR) repeat protein/transcriptional regulator with XRE-family HTH domain|nr:MAG: hypothetical protein OJF49_001859 [Ktedonobacterales bacterium]
MATQQAGQPLSFAALLKRYRRSAMMTQEELAERANYSISYISMLERGERTPVRATMELLAAALRIPSEEREAFYQAATRGPSATAVAQTPARATVAAFQAATPLATRERAPLAGRIRELAVIERYLSGEGSPALLLTGEPGIGKSRLLAEATRRADGMGWTTLTGGCQRRGQMPYAPLTEALERHIMRLPPEEQRAALDGCGWLARLLPELTERGLVAEPAWTLAPEQERRLMFAAVARYLGNVAGPAGTLLALDDLHWAGIDALDLLMALVRGPLGAPVRLIGAYREAETPPDGPLAAMLADLAHAGMVRQLALGPLAEDEATTLVGGLLPEGRRGDAALVAAVTQRAGGVPFFLVSYAQSLDAGVLGATLREEVPWDVAQSIRQRIAPLPEDAREVLEVAALAGQVVARGMLSAALRAQQSDEELARALEAVCQARLLAEEGEEAYQFTHNLIREVVARGLGAARRAALHRRIGEALEAGAGQPGQRASELLAYHYARGGEAEKAVVYLEEAGDRAQEMRAHAAAETYFQEVEGRLQELGRAEAAARACEKLGAVLRAGAQYDGALEVLARAVETYRAAGEYESMGRVAAHMGLIYGDKGAAAEGIAYLQPALAMLEARGVSAYTLATLYDALAQLFHIGGHYGEQLAATERACALAHAERDNRLRAQVETRRGNALRMLGRMDAAARVLEEAILLAEAAGDPRQLSYALENVSVVYLFRGEFARNNRNVERALELAERVGDPINVALMMLRRAMNRYLLGEWSGARGDFERAEAIMRQVDASWVSAYTALGLGQQYLATGEHERGVQHLHEAVARAEGSGDLQALRWAQSALAEDELLAGRPEAARARLTPLRGGQDEQAGMVTYLLPYLAWAELELGEEDAAGEIVAECVARATSEHIRLALVDALRVRALLAMRAGREAEAATTLEEALTLARAMPYPYAEAKLLYTYGLLAVQQGMADAARERFDAARTLLGRLGERLYMEQVARAAGEVVC